MLLLGDAFASWVGEGSVTLLPELKTNRPEGRNMASREGVPTAGGAVDGAREMYWAAMYRAMFGIVGAWGHDVDGYH